jgi:hypothetical protein
MRIPDMGVFRDILTPGEQKSQQTAIVGPILETIETQRSARDEWAKGIMPWFRFFLVSSAELCL